MTPPPARSRIALGRRADISPVGHLPRFDRLHQRGPNRPTAVDLTHTRQRGAYPTAKPRVLPRSPTRRLANCRESATNTPSPSARTTSATSTNSARTWPASVLPGSEPTSPGQHRGPQRQDQGDTILASAAPRTGSPTDAPPRPSWSRCSSPSPRTTSSTKGATSTARSRQRGPTAGFAMPDSVFTTLRQRPDTTRAFPSTHSTRPNQDEPSSKAPERTTTTGPRAEIMRQSGSQGVGKRSPQPPRTPRANAPLEQVSMEADREAVSLRRERSAQRSPVASSRLASTRARPETFEPPSVYPALRFHRRPS